MNRKPIQMESSTVAPHRRGYRRPKTINRFDRIDAKLVIVKSFSKSPDDTIKLKLLDDYSSTLHFRVSNEQIAWKMVQLKMKMIWNEVVYGEACDEKPHSILTVHFVPFTGAWQRCIVVNSHLCRIGRVFWGCGDKRFSILFGRRQRTILW